ncbi:methyltransferase family protein [Nocardioides speluncae]|uniref:methyltransferase family protein n=1 Tax=Nocardioides speluncae TaxID=2670337 RepID=UPI000D697163|nr:isoprenylcysteine carboxylmethyltransferase family protein [Nocardioides speluncae]
MVKAAVGSLVWFVLAPVMVAGVVPWWITRWDGSAPGVVVRDVVGGVLVVAGALVVTVCFVQFAVQGRGTPMPAAPTESLVVSGIYRYVRNPMYVGVGAVIAGQALAFQSWGCTAWLGVVALAFAAFVHGYEQPTLSREYGAAYERYRREVPGWWPRLTPYRG